eukprot:CAMPEP_0203862510 /NCGR_PEP_ID=MMETSP0359-20131031/13626_1 /ASSEMBLY_ACC=CAM_ASM_000338 /TAXON_ID=268821 /ORGANISM="Scrippsiella Hangoei, Strain SHTV-5" /LENGTH=505 /DNA_ID=CAMNT_0050779905 /DNA_START=61 /DNA_END=1578 /DNA_ORIENTATION=+
MTYGVRNVVGGLALKGGDTEARKGYFGTKKPLFGAGWDKLRLCRPFIEEDGWTLSDVCTYVYGAHAGHMLDFLCAFLCYYLLYSDGSWLMEAKEWNVRWVSRIVLFNLLCETMVCNFWHYFTYVSSMYDPFVDAGLKYNPENQYEPSTGKAGMFTSSTGHLEREITFSTLGWLQSAMWQCIFTHLWASGMLPVYTDFWAYPAYSLFVLWGIAYWRETHFYFAHRGMHPWWDRESGLLSGDVGAFLYRHVHSFHHKSYNPGPWSGLCMHPVEHFFYYSCVWLPPLFISVHPLHFLYCKFHLDIAPIGGHDGMDDPGGKGDFHYLHHAKFECNYGVPFPINLDKLFGTWADWETYKATGELSVGEWAKQQMHEPEDKKRQPLLAGAAATERSWSMDEVAKHCTRDDCFLVLYGQVINITDFVSKHPGGEAVLLSNAGKDATEKFEHIHAKSGGFQLVAKWIPGGVVGELRGWNGTKPPVPSEHGLKYPGASFLFLLLAAAAAGAQLF